MPTHPHRAGRQGAGRPRFEVADIFRRHGPDYARTHALSAAKRRVLSDVTVCRTAALGGHMDVCGQCGHERPSYNSCRNRHCPICQSFEQAKWIDARKKRILQTHYFHLNFTLPAELRPLVRCNQRELFGLLFKTTAQTLLTLGRDRFGATLGITQVLHTWDRKMLFHPHVHCIVTGGGLTDDGRWVSARPNFLFPVPVMRELFRGKFLDGLKRLHDKGKLRFGKGCESIAGDKRFARLLDKLYNKKWVVFAKRPFGGPEQVVTYLGQYTHRVAISSYRLLDVTNRQITIRTRGDGTESMTPQEFLRRFLLHVLPKSFRKIRHYGLLAPSNIKTRFAQAKTLLSPGEHPDEDQDATENETWEQRLERLLGPEARTCPKCKRGRLIREREIPPQAPADPKPDILDSS